MSEWLAVLIGSFIGGGIVAVVAGFKFAQITGQMLKTLSDHDIRLEKLHNGLYKEDGTLIYMPKEDCTAKQSACFTQQERSQNLMCQKLEGIKYDLVTIGGKREEEAKEFREALSDINVALAKINATQTEHLNNHKTNG